MELNQLTNTVIMISPDQYGFNPQTAETNVFQNEPSISERELQNTAMLEFNGMVKKLRNEGITVLVLPSRKDAITPDAVFPNNWFSHHQDGKLVLYPMLAPNRQAERQPEALISFLSTVGITKVTLIDFSEDEKNGLILEGTGSLVFDRVKKVAFAMESPRTVKQEFDMWCQKMEFEGIFFHAYDKDSLPIYHTNVVLSIGREFAVIALEAIKDTNERILVENKLKKLRKEVIPITVQQMYKFCGNILQLLSEDGKKKIVMSESAYNAFTVEQRTTIEKYGTILSVPIPLIETVSGGSTRCMLAEVFH